MPDLIRHPDVIPTKGGNQLKNWIPAFAGMMTFLETISLWTAPKYEKYFTLDILFFLI